MRHLMPGATAQGVTAARVEVSTIRGPDGRTRHQAEHCTNDHHCPLTLQRRSGSKANPGPLWSRGRSPDGVRVGLGAPYPGAPKSGGECAGNGAAPLVTALEEMGREAGPQRV
jgi:hypothetical protein